MYNDYLKILKYHNVNSFYHFTDIENIKSIFENGLCNRLYMDQQNIRYKKTDSNRYDKQLSCISLSIGTINKKMLYYKKNNYNFNFVIIELDAVKIITDFFDNIYYCKYNAASKSVNTILNETPRDLKSCKALENIFISNGKPAEQAEILLDGNIDSKYFKNIYVKTWNDKINVMYYISDNIKIKVRKEIF